MDELDGGQLVFGEPDWEVPGVGSGSNGDFGFRISDCGLVGRLGNGCNVQSFCAHDERQFFLLAVDVQIAGVPTFFGQVSDALHLDALRVIGVTVDLEVAALRQVFGPRLQLERIRAHAERQGCCAIDVEVPAQFGASGQIQLDGTSCRGSRSRLAAGGHSGVLPGGQVHSGGYWLPSRAVDNLDLQLAIRMGRCRNRTRPGQPGCDKSLSDDNITTLHASLFSAPDA